MDPRKLTRHRQPSLVERSGNGKPIAGQPASGAPAVVTFVRSDGTSSRKELFCSHSARAPEWVITAGHRVRYDNWDVTFRVGGLDRRHGKVVRRVENGTVFAPGADVALVRVPRLDVGPIGVGTSGSVKVGRSVRSYGWGPPARRRRTRPRASRTYDLLVGTGDFCAQRGTGLPAGGDPGGPATAFDKAGREVFVGVLSASGRTDVASFGDATRLRLWIRRVIRSGSHQAQEA
ncbi:trypsin-like serine protease [Streptomyces flaveolus]|uniref:trypsin-like serine protease n=1 Tax=Streptomyces flaveolus TaxID=67297 RepID=UPI00339FD882